MTAHSVSSRHVSALSCCEANSVGDWMLTRSQRPWASPAARSSSNVPARRRRAWAAGARARERAVEGRTGEGELGGLPVHLGEVLRLLGEAEDLPWHARRVGGVALAVGVPLARSVAERVERVVGWGSRRRRAPRHALGGVDERLSDLRHGRADFLWSRERRDPRAATAATEHSAHATRAVA